MLPVPPLTIDKNYINNLNIVHQDFIKYIITYFGQTAVKISTKNYITRAMNRICYTAMSSHMNLHINTFVIPKYVPTEKYQSFNKIE